MQFLEIHSSRWNNQHTVIEKKRGRTMKLMLYAHDIVTFADAVATNTISILHKINDARNNIENAKANTISTRVLWGRSVE